MPSDSIVFVDTNVLLYADDGRRLDKHRRARDWLAVLWMRRCGRVSTQVLNEYYANATGKLAAWVKQGDARAEVLENRASNTVANNIGAVERVILRCTASDPISIRRPPS